MRKPDGKNANGMPVRAASLSKIFPFHHRWRCTLDWEIMRVNEDTLHLMTGQKKLEDKYKDPKVLPKINKSDMAGTVEAIKEYLRLHCGVIRAPLAYVVRKTITV